MSEKLLKNKLMKKWQEKVIAKKVIEKKVFKKETAQSKGKGIEEQVIQKSDGKSDLKPPFPNHKPPGPPTDHNTRASF